MIIREFKVEHLDNFDIQDGQAEMRAYLEMPDYGDVLLSVGGGYSLFDGETLLACGGLAKQSNHKALAWSLISKNFKAKHMVFFTRKVKAYLNKSTYTRIEAIIRKGFTQAYRLAELLDFKCETPDAMSNWFPCGESAYLFSRVKCQV